ncbi:hypothetical protein ABZ404_37120 [Streptomyces sp. NPDC005878]|uniref:hypothetical protein n=1 Tax=Streptomyces sp. NPDC005878 TaxID=3157077 RepID=UPI0033DE03F7
MTSRKNQRTHRTSQRPAPGYRLVITIPGDTRRREYATHDFRRARSVALRSADRGAYVALQRLKATTGLYTTFRTYQPPRATP